MMDIISSGRSSLPAEGTDAIGEQADCVSGSVVYTRYPIAVGRLLGNGNRVRSRLERRARAGRLLHPR